ncbi:MAG: FAD-dependent tricarballylate dehydrogenase TcuA [Acidimicrobiales bacterium]
MEAVPVDVLVIGAGNAALCAALAARENGATVEVLECAPESERGGNTTFTAGAMRVVYNDAEDLRRLIPDLTQADLDMTDFGSYSKTAFYEDIGRVTNYRADPDLAEELVERSYESLLWMTTKGVRFAPIYGRQAFKIDGKFKFWGGLTVETVGGGPGLIDALCSAAARNDIPIHYETRAVGLLRNDDGAVVGVRVRQHGKESNRFAKAVVIGSGGFEANTEWRVRYLGEGWDLAKVRGSRFNTGEGIKIALEIGASPAGNWSGCHAVGWDMNAPEFGDLAIGDGFQKHSYPFGIMVNGDGERFVDEGADFRNFTYAKYGRDILNQPNQFAWQIFDQKVTHLLRDEYRIRQVTTVSADTLEDLADKLEGVDPNRFLATVKKFNESIDQDIPFDPNIKDGRSTIGIEPPKSNWANTLDAPPYQAYAVTCGVTFTFGGLRIEPKSAQVLNTDYEPIDGLFACGELVGGLFFFNYPGGTGLTSGSVFGRAAGKHAAASALGRSG